MQFKKKAVRQALLDSGEKTFLEFGFEKASLRTIVKGADTTIGNFYNYFESKSELFNTLVAEDYKIFMKLLNHHESMERPQELSTLSNPKELRAFFSDYLSNIVHAFGNGFILLIKHSKGTDHEETRELIIEALEEHFLEHMGKNKTNANLSMYAKVISSQFIDGFTSILVNYEKDEDRKQLLTEHLLFYIFGMMGLTNEL